MNKIFALFFIFILSTGCVLAQDDTDDYDTISRPKRILIHSHHDFYFSVGMPTTVDLAMADNVDTAQIYGRDSIRRHGAFSFHYYAALTNKFSVGVGFSYECISARIIESKNALNQFRAHNYYFSPFVVVRYAYFKGPYVMVYSKAAFGATYAKREFDTEHTNINVLDTDNYCKFDYQATPFGIQAGGAGVRAFLELGYGQQGIVQFGVVVRI